MPASPATRRLRIPLAIGAAFIAGIFVFLAVFAVVRYFNPGPTQALLAIDQRSPAALKFATLAGPTWSLADHPNHIIIVNYFATWCGPCKEELPDLQSIAKEFAPQNVDLVFLSFDQDADTGQPYMTALQQFAKTENVTAPILIPPRNSPLFSIETPLPQTFLIDKHARTAQSVTGPIDPEALRASLKKLLAEP